MINNFDIDAHCVHNIWNTSKWHGPFPNQLVSLFTSIKLLNTYFKAATGTMDYNEAVRGLASSTLGGILGTYQLGSLLAER